MMAALVVPPNTAQRNCIAAVKAILVGPSHISVIMRKKLKYRFYFTLKAMFLVPKR
jgi:hypothetical protein